MAKYQYKFNPHNCLYKDICTLFGTEDCNSVCERYIMVNYLLHHSQIPERHRVRKILQAPQQDVQSYKYLNSIRNNIVDFVEQGRNLYIFSQNKYNGKTSWAVNLMLKYFNEIWQYSGFRTRGVFVSVPMFLMKCKNVMSNPDLEFEQFKETLRNADLVIWDDIATTKLSQYDMGVLYAYISERMVNGKSNIYTGNMGKAQMNNCLGENLCSCICSNLYPVQFVAGEWREKDDIFTNIE